eukprot:135343-Chlamydomonas_euryale.AAC.4
MIQRPHTLMDGVRPVGAAAPAAELPPRQGAGACVGGHGHALFWRVLGFYTQDPPYPTPYSRRLCDNV